MRIYEELWEQAVAAFERRAPRLDPYLPNRAADPRRGVSLMFPLPAPVRTAIQAFLDRLAAEFPGQYYYPPDTLHVTVVTFIPATEHWRDEIGDVRAFRGIVREILRQQPAFEVDFRGVSAAPNAVIVQGFPRDGVLEAIRRDLRAAFVQRGFPNRLDRRYANQSAHVTAMRFCQPHADWLRLREVLQASRQVPFGAARVEALKMTWGDWYASTASLRVFETFPLGG